jgi:hypothetical protein
MGLLTKRRWILVLKKLFMILGLLSGVPWIEASTRQFPLTCLPHSREGLYTKRIRG